MFREASNRVTWYPIHVSVAVKVPAVTSRYHGTVREISKVTQNKRRLRHIHVKRKPNINVILWYARVSTSETWRHQAAYQVHIFMDGSFLIGQLLHVVLKVTSVTISLSKRRNTPKELSIRYHRFENLKSRTSNEIWRWYSNKCWVLFFRREENCSRTESYIVIRRNVRN
jgi:hypothetical protein